MTAAMFHELRRSEEGQTLILGALFGLVLMMCVLGTVNLGRAVYDKVQLQTAADAAAYSQAAVEARVMNFTAYTNRAMVVHYASVMAATSYLSYLHFGYPALKAMLQLAQFIPYIGEVFVIIEKVFNVLMTVLDAAVAALTPILAAANVLLYGLQEGAWWAVYLGRLAKSLPPEAHSGDSTAHPYQAIWPILVPVANQAVFAQTRGHVTMPQDSAETIEILTNAKSDAVQEARLHMLEVANSARQPWVAFGSDSATKNPISPIARHWMFKIIGNKLKFGVRARTEMGGFPGGTGLTRASQVWSASQLAADYKLPLVGGGRIPFFTFAAMDQLSRTTASPFQESYFKTWSPSGLLGKAIKLVLAPVSAFLKAVDKYAAQTKPKIEPRLFALSPYVYFAPRASSKPGIGPFGPLGNFGQPDVLVGLAKEGRDYNQEVGATKYYGRKFSWNAGGSAGKGSVDFSYTNKDWPQIAGMPGNLQVLHRGLNAFSAAQVYYHRPGDWKEMPNLFNPLWGARLMPVAESNVAAKLGFTAVPLIKQFLLH